MLRRDVTCQKSGTMGRAPFIAFASRRFTYLTRRAAPKHDVPRLYKKLDTDLFEEWFECAEQCARVVALDSVTGILDPQPTPAWH